MPSLPRSVFQTHFVEHSNYKSKPIFDLHDDWIEGKNKNSAMFMQIFKSARLLIGGSYKCLYHTVFLLSKSISAAAIAAILLSMQIQK
jgi:hypothetical protein